MKQITKIWIALGLTAIFFETRAIIHTAYGFDFVAWLFFATAAIVFGIDIQQKKSGV